MPPLRAITIVLGLAVAGTVRADELCVSCNEPEAVYRCETQGFTAGDARAEIACISELAKTEGHKSCGVDRRRAEPCDGPLKIVRRDMISEPPDYGPPTPAPNAAGKAAAPPQPSPSEMPSTLAGELKKAGNAAGETISNASRAVGAAAQNAWKCVSSFGADC